MRPCNRYAIILGALATLLVGSSDSYASQKRNIEVLTPRSGQRGTKVAIIMQGLNIRDAREVLFYRPGIRAISFENLPNRESNIVLHHGGLVKERVKCIFEIAKDCPLGEHPLRLRTKDTLTSVATFWVGPFPIVPELERGGFEVTYRGGETVVTANDKAIVQPNKNIKPAGIPNTKTARYSLPLHQSNTM